LCVEAKQVSHVYYAIQTLPKSSVSICRLVRDELGFVELWVFCFVTVDTVLNFSTELPDQALYGPRCGVSKSTDRVALNLE